MSDYGKQNRRQLLILDDIIDKLFASRLKAKHFDVLEKKLEKMETIVAHLSDGDSWSRGRDLFSRWKSRLSMWWERFAEEKEKSRFSETFFVESCTSAGKEVPKSSSSDHFSAPQLSFLPSHNRPPNVNVAKSAWPRYYYRMKRSFEKLSKVRSRDDSIRLQLLYNNVCTCLNTLIYKRLIGDHQIHNTVIKMATDKLPPSMKYSFQLENKNTLKALLVYLSEHLPKKIQTDTKGTEKDGDSEKLNLTSTKADVECGNSDGEKELEECELPEKDSFFTSTVPHCTQPDNTENMKQTGTESNSDANLISICSQIDRQFLELSLVHSETDMAGLKLLHRAVMQATALIKPYNSQLRVFLDRRIFNLAKCLMSTSWFWGVHPSKQTGAFMSTFLRSKILKANIASGRMMNQEEGKLLMSGQQQQPQRQQMPTKDCQTKKESKFFQSQNNSIIGKVVHPSSESSTDSTTHPEMAFNMFALNSFLATCRQEVSHFNKEPKNSL